MFTASPDGTWREFTEGPESQVVDVAIIGGGPAGAAAALTLLKYSTLRVAVIERSGYRSFRIGECLPPGATELLHYLGATETLAETEPVPARGVGAAWGDSKVRLRDFLFTGRGSGWHLDRRRFDEALAKLVVSRGGRSLFESRLDEAQSDREGTWHLVIRQATHRRPRALTARYVIDATGKRALFARRQSAKFQSHDRLVGISGSYDLPRSLEPGAFTIVEAAPAGWWYTAELPANRVIAVFMTDADLARHYRYHDIDCWNQTLATSFHTRRRLQGGTLRGSLRIHAAHSARLEPAVGANWIAAGDAAVSFDPLASMGIGYALLSGIEAARVAHHSLTGSGELARAYGERVTSHFARYLDLRRAYYRLEQRWADQPFWRRRH